MPIPTTAWLRPAESHDWPAIAALLRAQNLPLEGAQAHLANFIVAEQAKAIIGVVGLEIYADAALLRSLAVTTQQQNSGIGAALLQQVIALAKQQQVQALYLLTTTAADYFAAAGFVHTPRQEVPQSLQTSVEFASVCPTTASCMRLDLLTRA